jgi:hypothetical protein
MTTNLRVSLTILSVGFAIEGSGELYSFVSHGAFQPGVNLLFILPVAMTLAGLLFVWVGQHEWNELHRSRVRAAHMVFGLSLLGGGIGAATVGTLAAYPGLGTPLWAQVLFGASVGSVVLGTFITYVYLVFHLVPRPSQAALVGSIGWAIVVAAFIGASMASNLRTVIGLAATRNFSVPTFIGPVDVLASYLFVSYFLLLAAYLDAHRTVARGLGTTLPPPAEAPAVRPLRPADLPPAEGTELQTPPGIPP